MIEGYFKRIHYTGPRAVTPEILKAIHVAHAFNIPFENLEIHERQNQNNWDTFISLDIADIYNKIVLKNRGGHCLENNELLAFVLTELGFQVDRLMGRALFIPNLSRGHKMLLVTIGDDRWIADVGFGGHGIIEPLPFLLNQEFNQFGHSFSISQVKSNYIIHYYVNNKWKELLEFDLTTFLPIDYEHFNYSISHNPTSFFMTNRICSLVNSQGIVTLNNRTLKIALGDKEITQEIQDEDEYHRVLKKYFDIVAPNLKFNDMPSINDASTIRGRRQNCLFGRVNACDTNFNAVTSSPSF